MTVEERAKIITKGIITVHVPYDDDMSDEDIEILVAQALRDQIEECAKRLDNHKPVPVFAVMGYHESEDEEGNWSKDTISMPASNLIRALAGEKEGDDVQDKL